MSFAIHLRGEALVSLASLAEAELVAYDVGRENGIEHVGIWYEPDQAVGSTETDRTDDALSESAEGKAHASSET